MDNSTSKLTTASLSFYRVSCAGVRVSHSHIWYFVPESLHLLSTLNTSLCENEAHALLIIPQEDSLAALFRLVPYEDIPKQHMLKLRIRTESNMFTWELLNDDFLSSIFLLFTLPLLPFVKPLLMLPYKPCKLILNPRLPIQQLRFPLLMHFVEQLIGTSTLLGLS